MKYLAIILLSGSLLFGNFNVKAQGENKYIRKGNKLYAESDYKDAEIDYRRSLEENTESVKGKFNLGNSLYKQQSFEEAAKLYNEVAVQDIDKNTRAQAYHNLGNTLVEGKKYAEAVKAYKNSLILNPEDMDTKYNLEYAKRMLQQQQQQQQNKDQNQENKENKDKQDNKDQQKDQQKQDQQKQDQQQQDQQQQKDQQQQDKQEQDKQDQKQGDQQQQQQPQPRQISKEDAERMLEALKNDEKNTLEKLKKEKAKATKSRIEKDW